MADQTQSSLRQAVDRILGTQPGGNEPQDFMQFTKRAPISADLSSIQNFLSPTATKAALSNVAPAAAAPAAAAPIATPTLSVAASKPAVPAGPLYKTYNMFYANDPEALKYGAYHTSELPGGELDKYYGADKNPWKYAQGFNQYMNTLTPEYATLAGLGYDPSLVDKGAITGVYMGGKVVPVGRK